MASYVYGNTAKKENSMRTNQSLAKKQTRVSSRVQKNRKSALHMNKGYVVFLAVAAVVALFACVQYLQLQSEVTGRSKNIIALQRELETIKENNTTEYNSVMESMNLEEIRDKAVNEFGMVYAKEGQIVQYKDPTKRTMTRYSEIPESGIVASSDVVQ